MKPNRVNASNPQPQPQPQAATIPAAAIGQLKSGMPAVVLIDDGKQTNFHCQGLSLPCIIGMFSIYLKRLISRAAGETT